MHDYFLKIIFLIVSGNFRIMLNGNFKLVEKVFKMVLDS